MHNVCWIQSKKSWPLSILCLWKCYSSHYFLHKPWFTLSWNVILELWLVEQKVMLQSINVIQGEIAKSVDAMSRTKSAIPALRQNRAYQLWLNSSQLLWPFPWGTALQLSVQKKAYGDVGTLRHMIIVAWLMRAAFSCVDTIIAFVSDCCDTVAWAEWKLNKLASSVDAIAKSEIWNYQSLTHWPNDWPL